MRIADLLALSISLTACSSASTEPQAGLLVVTTQLLEYHPGDSVLVRFVNLGDQQLVYNACFAGLSRRVASAWVVVSDTSSLPCRAFALGLLPGAIDSTRFGLSANLASGVYKYVFDRTNFTTLDGVGVANSDRESNPFQVH
jgi:hypothetical protein